MGEQPSVQRHATDHGQVIAGQWRPQHRWLSARRVRARHEGQQIEARLVDEDDDAVLGFGFAWREGRCSSRQAVIAASSPWVARRIGCCTVHPICRGRRLTCAAWYRTPHVRKLTAATRLVVHPSPTKPYVSAPVRSRSGSWARCSAVSLGVAPGGGRWRNACRPPSRAACSHWLTAPRVTPAPRRCAPASSRPRTTPALAAAGPPASPAAGRDHPALAWSSYSCIVVYHTRAMLFSSHRSGQYRNQRHHSWSTDAPSNWLSKIMKWSLGARARRWLPTQGCDSTSPYGLRPCPRD